MNNFDATPSYMNGNSAMTENSDRKELERRLEQARRIAKSQPNLLTRGSN
jgi:hypothetical protein